jgi:peroxiredoxin
MVSTTQNPDIGSKSLDFTLKDQNGKEFTLSGRTGTRVVLSFHPLARTSVCSGQMKSLEEHHDALASLNTVAVGISVDSVPCKKAWADHLGIKKTSLLSDFWPHGGVAQAYGAFLEQEGFARRVNSLIDEHQKVAFVKEYERLSLPDMDEMPDMLMHMGR